MESLKSCLPPLPVDGNSASENERQSNSQWQQPQRPFLTALAVLPPQLPTPTAPQLPNPAISSEGPGAIAMCKGSPAS